MSAAKDPTGSPLLLKSSTEARGRVLKPALNRSLPLPVPAEVCVVDEEESRHFSSWASAEIRSAKSDLARELLTLRDARKRLSFMMKEIDVLLKRA
jgi:hypothetical protein